MDVALYSTTRLLANPGLLGENVDGVGDLLAVLHLIPAFLLGERLHDVLTLRHLQELPERVHGNTGRRGDNDGAS